MRRASIAFAFLLLASSALAVEPNLRTPENRGPGALRHVIVQASGPLTSTDREELAAKGVVIGRAMTRGRYLARVADGKTVADARVESIETIDPEKKISHTAVREVLSGKTWADINVYFHRDVTIDEARTALLASGAALEDPFAVDFGPAHRLTVRIAPSQLKALAGDDSVLGLTGPIQFKVSSDNARSAALSHVTELYSAPYELSGAGVTVSLFELAPAQADHVEFGGRLTVMDSVTGGTAGDKAHATHVSGTIGAAGVNPDAKGMAPQVKIYQFCVRAGGNTCKNDWLADKDEQLTKIGSHADNNSWGYVLGWEHEDYWVWNAGDDYFGAYELELVSPIDEISLDRGVLFVHSAGNEAGTPSLPTWGEHRHVDDNLRTITDKLFCYSQNGTGTDCPSWCTGTPCETAKHHAQSPYDTVGLTASGKNSIAVGAVQLLTDTVDIASFSSRGPAKDGRVKPDVVARGFGVLSSVPTNAYATNQGTSMSSPVVTGISALLVEQWRKTFAGADPTPVQLKALIIAGATDLGRPGPDYTFGFGLVNAKNSVDAIREDAGAGNRIRNISVEQGSTQEIPIIVSTPQDVRVVLQWGDPAIPLIPGEFIADKALVNDLDMKVVGPTGTEYLPYVLNKDQFEAPATTGINTVDNSEEVEIKGAAAGTYRIVVSGKSVPEGPQAAVVVSSVRAAAPCFDITETSNNNSSAPYGDLVTGQTISAGLCSATDVDFFRWTAQPGAVSVKVTTRDTPLKVTLSGGVSQTVTVPANTTQTITGTVTGTAARTIDMRVEAAGTLGAEPLYSFTPTFKAQGGKRRRATHH